MPNACQNGGTCHNTYGGYQCVCVNGWTGDDCSENIDDCASAACYQGSTCHDRVASFYCECPHGRTGIRHVDFCDFNLGIDWTCKVVLCHQWLSWPLMKWNKIASSDTTHQNKCNTSHFHFSLSYMLPKFNIKIINKMRRSYRAADGSCHVCSIHWKLASQSIFHSVCCFTLKLMQQNQRLS